jgi:hypothetical protein
MHGFLTFLKSSPASPLIPPAGALPPAIRRIVRHQPGRAFGWNHTPGDGPLLLFAGHGWIKAKSGCGAEMYFMGLTLSV